MSFQFFTGTQVSKSTTPKITVRRGGVLVFNEGAVRMLGDNVTHVRIAYDEETHAVAVVKADENAAGRYRLRNQKDSSSWIVNAKPMFEHFGLAIGKAKSFDVAEFGNGLIGVTLNGTLVQQDVVAAVAPSEQAESAPTGGKRKRA